MTVVMETSPQATQQNFVLANNESWEFPFVLTVAGDAGDIITNSKVHMMVRPDAFSTNVILEASLDNGLLTLYGPSIEGHVQLFVPAVRMRHIAPGTYVYDLIVERPTGRVYRLYAGTLTITQGVTELQVTPA